jgi:hypothetical protein
MKMRILISIFCLIPVLVFGAQDGAGTNVLESVRIKDGRSITFGGETRTNWPEGSSTDFGITDDTAYRGDWGAGVSNAVVDGPILTNANAIKAGKNAYAGIGCVAIGGSATSANFAVTVGQYAFADLYGVAIGREARAAANSVALGNGVVNSEGGTTKILGQLMMDYGSPSNGAPMLATGSSGKAVWGKVVAFYVQRTADFVFSNGVETTIAWDTELTDYGNCVNTTNFVAPVNGIYSFAAQLHTVKVSGATPAYTRGSIEVNGVDLTGTYSPNISDGSWHSPLGLHNYYLAAGARVGVQVRTQTTAMTNKISSVTFKSYFSGVLIKEFP